MTPERWQQAEDLFHQALEHAPEDRPAFLDRAAPDDPDMRRFVAHMLEADAQASVQIATQAEREDLRNRVALAV